MGKLGCPELRGPLRIRRPYGGLDGGNLRIRKFGKQCALTLGESAFVLNDQARYERGSPVRHVDDGDGSSYGFVKQVQEIDFFS